MTAKEAALEAIRQMPDDAPMEAIFARLEAEFGHAGAEDEQLTQEEWEEAWAEEAECRAQAMDDGKTVGVPHDEVMRRLREKYG